MAKKKVEKKTVKKSKPQKPEKPVNVIVLKRYKCNSCNTEYSKNEIGCGSIVCINCGSDGTRVG